MTTKSHCKGCGLFSEEVGLRWAGKGIGHLNLCKACAVEIGKGKLKVTKGADGLLCLSWRSKLEEAR